MKLLISADIEGVGAVVRREHSGVGEREYNQARKFMTKEVNAAINGAFDSGATEVKVVDAHNVGLNLFPEDLDERADLIMGSPRPLAMMEGIDRGVDAACFVGYHGMAGIENAAIAHIFHGRIAELRFNGLRVGEIGLNALIAGYYNVPVIMISGDQVACSEASELVPDIEVAQVKESIGAYAGICPHPAKCQEHIYQAVQRAMTGNAQVAPLVLEGETTVMEVRFTTASGADRALRLPGSKRVSGDTISYETKDFITAFQAFNTIADLMELVPFI